ncbi:MAG: sulfite exporter TauE/SafE family protein [Rhodoferax sp.]
MNASLALTALLMGLAGGPHCLAMCGFACLRLGAAASNPAKSLWRFQAGRLAGYSALGALAGGSVQGMAWVNTQSPVLRPVWTALQLAALGFGLMLLLQARQPAWVEAAGRQVWGRVRDVTGAWPSAGPLVLGSLWALMPCSLLYSALLLAMLAGSAWSGGLTMFFFALGTAASMTLGTHALQKMLRPGTLGRWRTAGVRLAGLALASASVWALWMNATAGGQLWCLSD